MKLILENWRKFLLQEDQDDSWKYYGKKGRDKKQLQTDRDWKKQWNSKADQNFFKNKVKKVHWIGGVHFSPGPRGTEFEVLPKIKSWGNLSKTHKDELSCIGYTKLPLRDDMSGLSLPAGILVDGYTSYAASGDIQSEWSSSADEKDKKTHSGSGLPKRANIKNNAMYDEKTFVEPVNSEGGYNELIVDNWKGIAIVINLKSKYFKLLSKKPISRGRRAQAQKARKEELKQIIEYCKSTNMKVVDMNLQEIKA
jgi:hypothetical protein